jgi:protein TonB
MMSTLPPGKVAGALPVFWRTALFIGVASIHGLGFAFVPKVSANVQGKAQAPAILQASWIEAIPAETPAAPEPAAIAPEPAAVAPEPEVVAPEPVLALPESTPAPRAKPKAKKQAPAKPLAKNKPKPVPAKPADAPEPAAPAVAASETQSQGKALASALAFDESPAAGAPGAPVSAAASAAGRGVPDSPVIPPSHANYLSNPRPDYPALSRAQGEQGVVSLYIHVSVEGKTSSVALYQTSGHARLDRAAMEAVRRWRFVPARQNGHPVAGAVIVPIRFDLRS